MKKIFAIIFISLLVFSTSLQAQVCNAVSAEAIPMTPQTGSYNYFGVRVTLSHTYYQNVTVTGYIYNDGDPLYSYTNVTGYKYNDGAPSFFTLTITAGNLTAETATNFYQTSPSENAAVQINSVSPCPGLAELIANHQSFEQLILISDEVLDMPTPDAFIALLDTTQLKEEGNEYLSDITGISLTAISALNQSLVENIEAFVVEFPELEGMSEEQLINIFLDAIDIYLSNQNLANLLIPGVANLRDIFAISMAGSTLFNSSFINPNKSSIGKLIHWQERPNEESKKDSQETTNIFLSNANQLSLPSAILFDPCSDCKRVGRAKMIAALVVGTVGCAGGGFYGSWACAVALFYLAGVETLACMRQHCPQQ